MRKEDLKDGMMVKDREGRVYLVFDRKLEALTDNFEWASLEDYKDNMSCEFFAKFDIMEVRDARNTNYSIAVKFKNYDSLPVLWRREEVRSFEEEYNFKPGDKVQVRDFEDTNWVNRYFLERANDTNDYKWEVTAMDEFTLGCTFEEARNRCVSFGYKFIRPYKED